MIDSGYRIPFYSMPPVSFSNNNRSALADAGFVTNRVFEMGAIPRNVNPLSVSATIFGQEAFWS